MHINEDELTPIYSDPLASRRFAGVLWRSVLLGALFVLGLGGVALVVTHELTERRAWDGELVFTAMASEMAPPRAAALIEASGRQALLLDESGRLEPLVPPDDPAQPRLRRWLERVVAGGTAEDHRQFTSEAPDGRVWWHTAIDAGGGRTLIVGRPASAAMSAWHEQILIVGGLSAAGLLGVGVVGALGFSRIGRPARLLADSGDQLRIRGRVSADLKAQLGRIRTTPLELRRLADNFDELETDLQQGDRRINALLNAGISLSGTLDPRTVLDRTLEHLELLLGVERTAIIRYDSRVETFEVVASRGHGDAYLSELATRADDPTLPSLRSLRQRAPVQVPDTEAEVVALSLRDRGRRHGYRSVLAIPLTDELEWPMVLLLHSSDTRTYSYDEVELSKSFAAIAGAALRNAELFEATDSRLRRQTSRLEAIVGSVDQGILVESARGRLLFANPIMRSLLPSGAAVEEGMEAGKLLDAVLARSDRPTAARAELERLEPGEDHVDLTLRSADSPAGSAGHAERTTDRAGTTDRAVTASRGVTADDGAEAVVYRVRSFVVRDARGRQIGRGQTWRDVSRERQLERMKSGLLAAVSHEFRTPLGIIKGYASTLLADDVSWNPGDQRQFLELVSAEADRLAELVKRILDMRRIDAGMVNLRPMPVDLDSVIANAVDALAHERHRIVVGPVAAIPVEIDGARIATALRNVLENACNYSPPGRPVEVSATATAGAGAEMVTVAVRDHGPGVPARLRDQIFDTFVRADGGLDAPQGGIGLGLAIAKGFVEAHGGRIWIDDPPGTGPGSVFCFTVPVADRAALEVVP